MEVIPTWEPNCWINITCPDDADRNYLLNELQLPDNFLSDIEDTDERPRVETEGDWTFAIIRIPYMKEDDSKSPYVTIPLGLIYKEDLIITICFFETNMMDDFIAHSRRKKHGFDTPVELLFRLLLSSSVWFLKLLKQINLRIEHAKRELERAIENKELLNLFHLENCLTFFITSLKGNELLLTKLKFKIPKSELNLDLLEDVEIELKQAHEVANIYSNILSGMMDAHASIISNNVNSIMRVMTSISIILMLPTLIASFYGMNLKNGMEEWGYGFPVIFGLTVLISLALLWLFRKRRWV